MATNGKARKYRLKVTTYTDGVPTVKTYSMITPAPGSTDVVPAGFVPLANEAAIAALLTSAYLEKVDLFLVAAVPDHAARTALRNSGEFDDAESCPLPGIEPDEPTITEIRCKYLANGCWSGNASYTLSNGYSSPGNVPYVGTGYEDQIYQECYVPTNGTGSACPVPYSAP